MILSRVWVGAAAVTLLLSGCAPTVVAAPSASPTPAPTVSATPEVPVATSLLLTRDGLSVLDIDGAIMESALFADGDTVVALISSMSGSQPTIDDSFAPKGIVKYGWPGTSCSTIMTLAFCEWTLATVGGLPITTSQGIHVGSSRAEVAALNPVDVNSDGDGDGVSDVFGLEAAEVPGTQSLAFPGQVGTGYIGVRLEGDTVIALRAVAGDFYDL